MKRVLILVAVPLFFPLNTVFAQMRTSVCEVKDNPTKFADKVIDISGQFESDGVHGMAIIDPQCKLSLIISMPNRVLEKPSAKPLEDAIFHDGHIGTMNKYVAATLRGKLIVRNPGLLDMLLEVEDVLDVARVPPSPIQK